MAIRGLRAALTATALASMVVHNAVGQSAPVIDLNVPASLPYAPDVRFFPQTSTTTLRTNGTFQAYVAPFNSTGSKLTVVAAGGWPVSTVEGLNLDMYVTHASLPGGRAKIIGMSNTNSPAFATCVGTWLIDAVGVTIGASGAEQAFGVEGRQIVSATDYTGNSTGLASRDGVGPREIVEANGRKGWLFYGNLKQLQSWLENTTYTGVDTLGYAWLIYGRVLNTIGNQTPNFGANTYGMISAGYCGSAQMNAFTDSSGQLMKRRADNTTTPLKPSIVPSQTTRSKMFLRMQPQIFGVGRATADGYNGTNTSYTEVHVNNDEAVSITGSVSGSRQKNITGFTLNAFTPSSGAVPTSNSHAATLWIIYDAVGFLRGQMGTSSTLQTRMQACSAAMMAYYSVPVTTRNLVYVGDSRAEENGGYYTTYSGWSFASRLCDPGSQDALPANVGVMCVARQGEGIGSINSASEMIFVNSLYGLAWPYAPDYTMGGAKDYLVFWSGTNDVASIQANQRWPGLTAGVVPTNAQIDDIYGNSGGYTGSFTAAVPVNTQTLTITSPSGTILDGSMITGGSGGSGTVDAGQSVVTITLSGSTPTGGTMAQAQSSALSGGVVLTCQLDGYVTFIKKMLGRGVKIMWVLEPRKNDTSGASGNGYFNRKVFNNALNDCLAGPGQTYDGKLALWDPTLVVDGTKTVYGAQYIDYNKYYMDPVHHTELSKITFAHGGDDGTKGLLYSLNAWMT